VAVFTSVEEKEITFITGSNGWPVTFPTQYGFYQNDLLTSDQISDLYAGHFYIGVISTDGQYLAELTPVPEPGNSKLVFCGFGLFVLFHAMKSRKKSVPCIRLKPLMRPADSLSRIPG